MKLNAAHDWINRLVEEFGKEKRTEPLCVDSECNGGVGKFVGFGSSGGFRLDPETLWPNEAVPEERFFTWECRECQRTFMTPDKRESIGRPIVLTYPGELSPEEAERIKAAWEEAYKVGGVEKFEIAPRACELCGRPVLLAGYYDVLEVKPIYQGSDPEFRQVLLCSPNCPKRPDRKEPSDGCEDGN